MVLDSASIRITAPASGESVSATLPAGGKAQFAFNTQNSSFARVDDSLLVKVDGGGEVTLKDFFKTGGSDLPSFVLSDGTTIAGKDFLAGMNPNMDLSTAAGPAASSAPTSGGTSYDDEAGSLVGGVEKMGSLGTDHWGVERASVQQAESGLYSAALGGDAVSPAVPSGPDTSVDPGYDERFIITVDGNPVTSGPVLHNDGRSGTVLAGVYDLSGNFVALADLNGMDGGNGLRMRFGWLRLNAAGELEFAADPAATAADAEVVTYAALDGNGDTYTQRIQIRFTDASNAFASEDKIDSYYHQEEEGAVNLKLGGGDDFVRLVNVSGAGDVIALGVGNDSFSATATENDKLFLSNGSFSLDVGAGKDVVSFKDYQALADENSTFSLVGGEGDKSIFIGASEKSHGGMAWGNSSAAVTTAGGNDTLKFDTNYVAYDHSTVSINTGAGNDSIDWALHGRLSDTASTVEVRMGEGDDTLNIAAAGYYGTAANSSTLLDLGNGNNTLDYKSTTVLVTGDSTLNVVSGDGNDTLTMLSGSVAVMNAEANIASGGGDDVISFGTTGKQLVNFNASYAGSSLGHLDIDGGAGNDSIEIFNNDALTRRADICMIYRASIDLHGGEGNDTLYVHGNNIFDYGSLRMDGGEGHDTLLVDVHNVVGWGPGTLYMNGGEGNDLIHLRNGSMDTRTYATWSSTDYGYGNNALEMTGGSGADTFKFGDDNHTAGRTAVYGRADIMDFNTGEGDKLDLSALFEVGGGKSLDDYLHFSKVGNDIVVDISKGGTINASSETDHVKLVLHDAGAGLNDDHGEILNALRSSIIADGL